LIADTSYITYVTRNFIKYYSWVKHQNEKVFLYTECYQGLKKYDETIKHLIPNLIYPTGYRVKHNLLKTLEKVLRKNNQLSEFKKELKTAFQEAVIERDSNRQVQVGTGNGMSQSTKGVLRGPIPRKEWLKTAGKPGSRVSVIELDYVKSINGIAITPEETMAIYAVSEPFYDFKEYCIIQLQGREYKISADDMWWVGVIKENPISAKPLKGVVQGNLMEISTRHQAHKDAFLLKKLKELPIYKHFF